MRYSDLRYSNPACALRCVIVAGALAGSLVTGAACGQGGSADVAELGSGEVGASPAPADMPTPDAAGPDAVPDTLLGEFQLTYYWMAKERDSASERDVQLYTKKCEPLAMVSKSFATRLTREGTGKLLDGRTINVSGECKCDYSPCFFIVDRKRRWGVGVYERPLSPFRSVAVDPTRVSIGTILYLPELDGLTMPGRQPWGGFVHDGCVVADDTGGKVTGNQIDLFMAHKPHYRSFYRRYRMKRVTVMDGRGRCERDSDNKLVRVNRNST
jgi:3D (Asp-Asp-Asp) domain-containing protein